MDMHLAGRCPRPGFARIPAHPKSVSFGAEAGIQYLPAIFIKTIRYTNWTPAFAGVTEGMFFHRLSGRVISGHVYALLKAGHTKGRAVRI